jgi:hypothetical protein
LNEGNIGANLDVQDDNCVNSDKNTNFTAVNLKLKKEKR